MLTWGCGYNIFLFIFLPVTTQFKEIKHFYDQNHDITFTPWGI